MGDEHIAQLEQFAEHLASTNPRRTISLKAKVFHDALREESHEDEQLVGYHESEIHHFERMPSVMELLDLMGSRPLKDQVYMICNLLTISGFTQAEIAEVLGIAHKTYRNSLLDIRKELRERTDQE